MTGSVGGFSFYTVRGSDKIIVRTKGGAKKEHILNNPAFARTREQMSEFKACGKWCKQIRHVLQDLDELNYGLYMSGVVSLSSMIQKMDYEGSRGLRSIYSSRHKSYHSKTPFCARATSSRQQPSRRR